MLENNEEIQRIKDLLKKKKPQLNDEEIDKISNQLYQLGLILVQLQIKKIKNICQK